MNAGMVNHGWPWLTIREDERGAYFGALKTAQLGGDAVPFAELILRRELDATGGLAR